MPRRPVRRPSRRHPADPDAERRLVAAAQSGDGSARAEIIVAFLPAIRGVARRYRTGAQVTYGELMQEGVVGLLRAVDRFDCERETPFWAYASWWVRQAMQDVVSELARPVVLSDRALRQLARVNDARRAHVQARKGEPTTTYLAEHTGLPREHVERLIAVDRTARGLAEPVGGEDGGTATLAELLADPRADDEEERLFRRLEVEYLLDVCVSLCRRERSVLRSRYGVGAPERTRQEIARELGVSAERVRQIEQGALEKLRTAAEA